MKFGPLYEDIILRYKTEAGVISSLVVILFIGLIMYRRASLVPTENLKPHIMVNSGSAVGTDTITVDIEGAVNKSGVYKMPSQSLIHDAIRIAGGFAKDADRVYISKYYNLAQHLNDEDKIYIPSLNDRDKALYLETGIDTILADENKQQLVNINTADKTALSSLPRIGEVTSQKIIDNRPYRTIFDLTDKKVVGQAIFEAIKDKISTE